MYLITVCLMNLVLSFSCASEELSDQSQTTSFLDTVTKTVRQKVEGAARYVRNSIPGQNRQIFDPTGLNDITVDGDFTLISGTGDVEIRRLRKEIATFNEEVKGLTDSLSITTQASQATAQELTDTISFLQQNNKSKSDTIRRLHEEIQSLKRELNPSYSWGEDLMSQSQHQEVIKKEDLKIVLDRYQKLLSVKNTFEKQLQEMAAQQNALLDSVSAFQKRLTQLSSENHSLVAQKEEVEKYSDESHADFTKMLADKENHIRALTSKIGQLEQNQERLETIVRIMFAQTEKEQVEDLLTALNFSVLEKKIVRNLRIKE